MSTNKDIENRIVRYNYRSKLEASSCVWSPYEASYSLMLEKVQKRFLRFLYKCSLGYYPYMYPTKYLVGCLGFNMLDTRRNFNQLHIALKIYRGIIDAPDLHNELVRLYAPNTTYALAGTVCYLCPHVVPWPGHPPLFLVSCPRSIASWKPTLTVIYSWMSLKQLKGSA
ncbi:hypothetical protein SFRURICE_003614 [Spodoptera frugiperda]|nr:hypothetical protein SFRURICE_003614 [Spodoptera frugiperda]